MGNRPSSTSEDIDLTKLPFHIQVGIVEKMTYEDAATFEQCSKEAEQLRQECKQLLPYETFAISFEANTKVYPDAEHTYIKKEPKNIDFKKAIDDNKSSFIVNRVIVNCSLSDQRTKQILRILERGKVKAKTFSYYTTDNFELCDVDNFERMISISGAKHLHCPKGIDSMYLRSGVVQNMDRLVIFKVPDLMDSTFLDLKATEIELSESPVAPEAINLFFKQWIKDERVIKLLRIFDAVDNFDIMFEGTEHKQIWSQKKGGKLGRVSHVVWDQPEFVYQIRRPTDKEVLYVSTMKNSLKVLPKSLVKKNKQLCHNQLRV